MTELMPSLCNDCVARNQCGNDDVKMCISYTKETKIKCDDCKFVEDCVDYGWKDCKKFTQKATEPMTEQEYIQTCNTEQLAEFLIASIKKCKSCASGIGVDEVQHCPFGECGCHFKGEVIEWLKKPHSEVGK